MCLADLISPLPYHKPPTFIHHTFTDLLPIYSEAQQALAESIAAASQLMVHVWCEDVLTEFEIGYSLCEYPVAFLFWDVSKNASYGPAVS